MKLVQAWLQNNCKFAEYLDLNYWISPDGNETHAPNASHSGVAAEIIKQRNGDEIDPTEAYHQLLSEGWIRISDFMFEIVGHDERKKNLITNFMDKHSSYYNSQPTIEIDDNAGDSRQYETNAYRAGEEGEGDDLPVAPYDPGPTSNFYSQWAD